LNLDLHGIMENLKEPVTGSEHASNLSRLKVAAELGQAVSPRGRVVVETILGGKPAEWPQVREKLVEQLGDWSEIGKNAKTAIAVKPHVANALHTVEDALWLVKKVNSPWLRLAFDHSHFELRGVKPLDAAAAIAPFAAFAHVKDAKGTAEKFEFLLPGDGKTDYAALATALVKVEYRGPVVVEVSGQISNKAGYDPEAVARQCYLKLRADFGKKPRK
jgi:inosose dehydratase